MESISLWRTTRCCVSVWLWHSARYYDNLFTPSHSFIHVFIKWSLFSMVLCLFVVFYSCTVMILCCHIIFRLLFINFKMKYHSRQWPPHTVTTSLELASRRCVAVALWTLPVENVCSMCMHISRFLHFVSEWSSSGNTYKWQLLDDKNNWLLAKRRTMIPCYLVYFDEFPVDLVIL